MLCLSPLGQANQTFLNQLDSSTVKMYVRTSHMHHRIIRQYLPAPSSLNIFAEVVMSRQVTKNKLVGLFK